MNNLNVYLYNELAGAITKESYDRYSFKYNEDYLKLKNSRQLSISMPLTDKIYENDVVLAYFYGCLPDGEALKQLTSQLKLSKDDLLPLLASIGGECLGALSFFPGEINHTEDLLEEGHILDENNLFEIISIINNTQYYSGRLDLKYSLPGAQNKIAVNFVDNQLKLVKGTYFTSHILKLPLIDRQDSLQNELFCMRLAHHAGFKTPDYELKWCNDQPYLLIKRYDRLLKADKTIVKLHQESFCQAMSVLPEDKTETKGGPKITDCLNLIEAYSKQPASDKLSFIRILIFNYLIGNSDTNAKNFSFLYTNDKMSLAPVSNLLSNCIYAKLSPKMSMPIDDKYYPNLVRLNHWYTIVNDNSTARNMIDKELQKMAAIIPDKAISLQAKLYQEGIKSDVFDHIVSMVIKRSKHITRYSQNQSKITENRNINPQNTFDKIITPDDIYNIKQQSFFDKNIISDSNHNKKQKGNLNPSNSTEININLNPKSTFDKISNRDVNYNNIPKEAFGDKINQENNFDNVIDSERSNNKPQKEAFENIIHTEETKIINPKSTFDKISSRDFNHNISQKETFGDKINQEDTYDNVNDSEKSDNKSLNETFENIIHTEVNKIINPKSTFDKISSRDVNHNISQEVTFGDKINQEDNLDNVNDTEKSDNKSLNETFENIIHTEDNKIINPKSTFDKLINPDDKEIFYEENNFERANNTDENKAINPKNTFNKLFKKK